MTRHIGLLIGFWVLTMAPAKAAETYRTQVSSKQIKSLQVKVEGETISAPYIELGGNKYIEINFDALYTGYSRYAYSLVHCDADWTRSRLSQIEYLDGFQGNTIDDFATSMSTTVHYTNYRLLFPNDDMRPKVSGNYALQVYGEDDPSTILFTACFSVYESQIGIDAEVSSNTDIDLNQAHQQVSFTINSKGFPITFPQSDLKIWVYQNNRRDNAVSNLQPTIIAKDQIAYTNNRNLIFTAGNEYRRMEFLSDKYNGMHVESVSFHNPYYHIELMTDKFRGMQTYSYDQDQNGRFFIRCSNCDDTDTEADYYIVHFTLAMERIPAGNVYLNGDLCQNLYDENSLMPYNEASHRYEKAILLKQGNYNYQYVFVPDGETVGKAGTIEGDYYQTENEYRICVYYCPMGARYDRLIGVSDVKCGISLL